MLKLDQPLGPGVRLAEDDQANDSKGSQQSSQHAERDKELGLDRRANSREPADERA